MGGQHTLYSVHMYLHIQTLLNCRQSNTASKIVFRTASMSYLAFQFLDVVIHADRIMHILSCTNILIVHWLQLRRT